jgi:DNA-binding CsgD family transcriptional regulator
VLSTEDVWVERESERSLLEEFVGRLREGLSGSLAILGEAGSGKTSLVGRVRATLTDVRFVTVIGTEAERLLPYAGLQQLLLPFAGDADDLPAPQRDALAVAFGLTAGSAPSRFLIGIAALTLLARAAREQPVLCLIDDAQWLDAESLAAIGFVGRRLEAESLGLLATVRADAGTGVPDGLDGWATVRLTGLDADQSGRLLAARYGRSISVGIISELSAGTRGNPLALVAVADSLTVSQRLGRSPLPDPLPVGPLLERLFSAQVTALPPKTRALLLLASASGSGDQAVLWRAGAMAGLAMDHLDAAVAAGVATLAGGVGFRHPLVRSAVYAGASAADRRAAHGALAQATDPASDPDRRAWHLAAAALGPDEDVAAELERSSERAAGRGGFMARAALLQRAGDLSVDQRQRIRRHLMAAQSLSLTGSWEAVQELLDQLPQQLTGQAAAQRDGLRAALAMGLSRPGAIAGIILQGLRTSTSGSVRVARDALLEAVHAVTVAGTLGDQGVAAQVGAAALAACRDESEPLTGADRLMAAFASRILDRDAVAYYDLLRAALPIADEDEGTSESSILTLTWYAYGELWDLTGQRKLMSGLERRLRAEGALPSLALILFWLGLIDVKEGRIASADVLYTEAAGILQSLGSPAPEMYKTPLYAWQGREQDVRRLAALAQQVFAEQLNRGLAVSVANHSLLILEVSLGRYAEGLPVAHALFAEDSPVAGSFALPTVVEAAVRAGDQDLAGRALARLAVRAESVANPYVLGLLARSTALVHGEEPGAEEHYATAISRLEASTARPDLAWAHLLYGEWLRRRKRRADARAHLRTAYESFTDIGAPLFAERARAELAATGERVSIVSAAPGANALTPQEARIAGLAADGATNQEIATKLFISASTVEYHLTKIFRKHRLTSRRELRPLLPPSATAAPGP